MSSLVRKRGRSKTTLNNYDVLRMMRRFFWKLSQLFIQWSWLDKLRLLLWSKKLAKKLEFAMRKNYCLTEDENTSENSSLSLKNRPSCTLALGHVDLGSKQAREHCIVSAPGRQFHTNVHMYNGTFYNDTIFTKDLKWSCTPLISTMQSSIGKWI